MRMAKPCASCRFATCKFSNLKKKILAPPSQILGTPLVTTSDINANMCDVHTSIVSQHLAARDNDKTLRTHPPQVSSTEENLPRHTRRTLAQLRRNKSPFLLLYLHKIDASTQPSPLCPLCRTHELTTQHLFSCPQICTTLSSLDLWRDPSGVAALLDDWREKLTANPHNATETDSPQ